MDGHHLGRREKPGSGDSFSFPSTPNQDSPAEDFEFGSLTPDSPSSDPSRASPADHLFFNGRLLPHSFPPLPPPHPTILLCDHHASRTTTNCSSFVLSSRSNSTNSSRSSSCSSARTSSSDSSERRLFYNRASSSGGRSYQRSNKTAYGCSQRWQYITPVPAATFARSASRRRNSGREKEEAAKKKKREDQRLRVGRRFFRWVLMACKVCHAMEPSKKRENVARGR